MYEGVYGGYTLKTNLKQTKDWQYKKLLVISTLKFIKLFLIFTHWFPHLNIFDN